MRSVALDLGGKITFCEVADGKVLRRATASSFEGLKLVLGPRTPPARVAIEACREAWHIERRLREWGHEPLVVDTTRVKQLGVGQHKRKSDRIDAEVLARAVEMGGVPLAHVLSPHRQALRMQLGIRRGLVETRAGYVTMIRGLARAHGVRLPSCKAEDFARKIECVALGEELRLMVAPLLENHPRARPCHRGDGPQGRDALLNRAGRPAAEHGSGRGSHCGRCLRLGDRRPEALPPRTPGRGLSRSRAERIHLGSPTAGEHHQAREQLSSFPARSGGLVRGSNAYRGPARTVGQSHRPAAWQVRGSGRAGPAPCRRPLGDVAQWHGLRCRAPGALIGTWPSAAGPDTGAADSGARARCTQDPTLPSAPLLGERRQLHEILTTPSNNQSLAKARELPTPLG